MNSVETISIASLLQTAPSRGAVAGSCKKGLQTDTRGDKNVLIAGDTDQYESAAADVNDVRMSQEPQSDSGSDSKGQTNQLRSGTRGEKNETNRSDCDAVSASIPAADFCRQIIPEQPNLPRPFAEIIAQVTQIAAETQNAVVETSAESLRPAAQIPDAVMPQVQFVMPQPEAPAAAANVPQQQVVAGQPSAEVPPVQPMQLQGGRQMFSVNDVPVQVAAEVERGETAPAAPEVAAVSGSKQEVVVVAAAASTEKEISPQLSQPSQKSEIQVVDRIAPVAAATDAGKAATAEPKPAAEQRVVRPESDRRHAEDVDSKPAVDRTVVTTASYRDFGRPPVERTVRDGDGTVRSFGSHVVGAVEAGVKPLETVSSVAPQAVRPAVLQPAGAADIPPAEQITQFAGNLRVGQQITVQLNPPELGRVRLSLQSDGKDIRGVVEVDSHRTLVEIQKEASSLMGRMADSGISVRRMDVVLSDPSQGGHHGADSMLRDWSGQHGHNRDSYASADPGRNLFAGEYADEAEELGELVTDSSINVRI